MTEGQLLEPVQLMDKEVYLLGLGLESLVERALAMESVPALERIERANVLIALMEKLDALEYQE